MLIKTSDMDDVSRIPDYLFVYGILNDGSHSKATLRHVVKVRKAYGNRHVCLESHMDGEVDGALLPVLSPQHLAYLDSIEGDGYRRVTVHDGGTDALVQTYWYKDMPINVDSSTGKPVPELAHGYIPDNGMWGLGLEHATGKEDVDERATT